MKNITSNITRDDMIWAIKQIDCGNYQVEDRHRSRLYCIEYKEGRSFRHFPPKEVISLANTLPNGVQLRLFFGGVDEANKFCVSRGFKIIEDCGQAPH
jgi:hypothetical protein